MISAIKDMDCQELGRAKLNASRILSSQRRSEEIARAKKILAAVEKRERQLESEHLKKAVGVATKLCSSCGRRKPLDDSYLGFGFKANGQPKAQCKACHREYARRYHSNNPDVGRQRAHIHQVKRAAIGGDIDEIQAIDLRKRQGDKCAYCGAELKGGGELDHFVPVEKGGGHGLDNRVWACRSCNRNKGRKLPKEFLQERRQNNLPIRDAGFFSPKKRNPAG
jgi:5-methylcytosine-specific restriction endonuclease McrA